MGETRYRTRQEARAELSRLERRTRAILVDHWTSHPCSDDCQVCAEGLAVLQQVREGRGLAEELPSLP
jgi:hypothetical protein